MEIPEEPFIHAARSIRRDVAYSLAIPEEVLRIEIPSRPELGDLAIPLHQILKERGLSQEGVHSSVGRILSGNRYVAKFSTVSGYLDVWLDSSELSKVTFSSIEFYGDSYGVVRARESKRYVVEYVSANPVHPLHIGSGRNAALGIAITSMLRLRGHSVEARFYVNDMGRQVTIMVLGFRVLGMPDPPEGVKEDHWIGYIYASTNVILEILSIKRRLEELRERDPEGYREKVGELDSLMADAARLSERFPQVFNTLAEKLSGLEDPEGEISRLMASYEKASDPEVVRAFRRAVELCLRGFRKTLQALGAEFDRWDFESDLAWEGVVEQVIQAARSSKYYGYHKGAPAIAFDEILRIPGIRDELKLPKTLEIPPLILMRSDETTLYTVRDIGYSIKKFRESRADYVINIIASEQLLPQAQLRLALYALGFKSEAPRLIHYSYEIVSLPGQRMSGRRGRYVTLDEVIEEAVARSMEILRERGSGGGDVARAIGISAVKYALASVSASKPITFKIEEALNIERNSAPYIMYTYARASSILEKAGEIPSLGEVDHRAAEEGQKRRQILLEVARAPSAFTKAIDELKPEDIASTLVRISDLFNSWYQEDPVIREQNPGARAFKVHLVRGVRQVLRKGLEALGIKPLERI